jgi:hypothetical protein
MNAGAGVAIALVVAVALGGCGGDEAKASLADYCTRSAAMQQKGTEFFKDFNPQTKEEADQAFVEFAKVMHPEAKATLEVAPDEVREDVKLMLSALGRTAEGDVAAFVSAEAQAASDRLDDFERERCAADGGPAAVGGAGGAPAAGG